MLQFYYVYIMAVNLNMNGKEGGWEKKAIIVAMASNNR